MRIQKAGGTVQDGRVSGILEGVSHIYYNHQFSVPPVSRSMGDGRFKHLGVIATPDVFRFPVTDEDRFLLIACDGLWKVGNM